jgi:long-chain acyl-CoA synthetase
VSSFGRNITPEWPEAALLSTGLFRHCVVFGDARPHCIALLEPLRCDTAHADIAAAVAAANRQLPDYARIARWTCVEQPLSAEPGLLTSNGRPRRDAIAERYRAQLEALYSTSHDTDNRHGLLSVSG